MRASDQCSNFSIGGKFCPDYGLLLELHALTLAARSYALLIAIISVCHAVQLFTLGLLHEVVLSSVRVDNLQLVRQGLVETGLWEFILHPGHHEEDDEWQSGCHSQWKLGVR